LPIRSPEELESELNASAEGSASGPPLMHALNERLRAFPNGTPQRFAVRRWPRADSFEDPWVIFLRWNGHRFEISLHHSLYEGHDDTGYILDRAFIVAAAVPFALHFTDRDAGAMPISLNDWGHAQLLSFTGTSDARLLIPDTGFLGTVGYEWFRVGTARGWVPWKERRPVALWRGALNGLTSHVPDEDWSWLPRAHLCSVAEIRHRGLVDAKLTRLSAYVLRNYPEQAERARRFLGDPVEPFDHMTYRYLLDIDGWANAWTGLFQRLLTGSVVLKVASHKGFRQWYYDRLIPWVNFVPVRSDLSDLGDALAFVVGNDAEAHAIGSAGRHLALSLSLDAEIFAMATAMSR
jgi:hypothetical protein